MNSYFEKTYEKGEKKMNKLYITKESINFEGCDAIKDKFHLVIGDSVAIIPDKDNNKGRGVFNLAARMDEKTGKMMATLEDDFLFEDFKHMFGKEGEKIELSLMKVNLHDDVVAYIVDEKNVNKSFLYDPKSEICRSFKAKFEEIKNDLEIIEVRNDFIAYLYVRPEKGKYKKFYFEVVPSISPNMFQVLFAAGDGLMFGSLYRFPVDGRITVEVVENEKEHIAHYIADGKLDDYVCDMEILINNKQF